MGLQQPPREAQLAVEGACGQSRKFQAGGKGPFGSGCLMLLDCNERQVWGSSGLRRKQPEAEMERSGRAGRAIVVPGP